MSNLFLEKRKKLNTLWKLRKNTNMQAEDLSCPSCDQVSKIALWEKGQYVCPKCGYHKPINAEERIGFLLDKGSFKEMLPEMKTKDPISFPSYDKKLGKHMEQTNMCDALMAGAGKIDGNKIAIAVLDSSFLMGSMGTVVGEKLARIIEHAGKRKLPLLIFSASGGARMQEGLFSLMQMAKTSAAIERYKENGGFYISCLTHPTTGGVSASFANLGDVILAEPKALIGFAGPRVIKQTIGQTLPEGFQRSEFLEEHGFVDQVIHREDLKKSIVQLLLLHQKGRKHGK